MGVDFNNQTTDFQNKCLGSIEDSAKKAYAERDQKEADATIAMNNYNKLKEAKAKAYSKYHSLLSGKDQSAIKDAKSSYMSVLNLCIKADWDSDIKNSAALDCIFSAGKFGNQACIAESIFNA